MRSPPIDQAEIDARVSEHIRALLELWWAEQGSSKPKDLNLISLAVPFARHQAIRVLDLCCGPGDVGRAIHQIYPNSHVDCVDQDPFFTAICRAENERLGVSGKVVVRDLNDDAWLDDLVGPYDVVAVANALHWFDSERAERLVQSVSGRLRADGIFLLAEPVSPEEPFASGFEVWKTQQPPRYTRENWERFWARANAILGYDHPSLWEQPAKRRIGDELTVAGWLRLLASANFACTDVLLRDADQVIIAAVK
jgi:SAM-dependent methyltransferase